MDDEAQAVLREAVKRKNGVELLVCYVCYVCDVCDVRDYVFWYCSK